MEEKKKSKAPIIILVVVLIIIILGLAGYICYDKGLFSKKEVKTSPKQEEKVDKAEEIDVNSDEVKNLFTSIRTFEEKTYTNKELSNTTISSEDKITYAIGEELLQGKNIESSKEKASLDDNMTKSFIKWGTVKDRVKLLFGSNTSIEKVTKLNVNQAGAGCFNVEYAYCEEKNENECKYTLDPFGCDVGWRFDRYETRDIKAIKKSESIVVTRQVLHLAECNPETTECKIVRPTQEDKELGKAKGSKPDLSNFFDKGDTIEYTFKLENGNYYFESSKVTN